MANRGTRLGGVAQEKGSAVHTKSCFNVEYSSNEVGARDTSFEEIDHLDNVVLLGDTFAEGYGVKFEETSQYLLETGTGKNILNFGATGSFGPLQYLLIYEQLASKYRHEAVLIYFLPANDFTDNDYSHWLQTGYTFSPQNKERYRPYFNENTTKALELFYPEAAEKRAALDAHRKKSVFDWREFLLDNFWSANVLRTSNFLLKVGVNFDPYSGYFDASEAQQTSAIAAINAIVETAGDIPVILVSIPTKSDFVRMANGDNSSDQSWWKAFKALETENENVVFLDLSQFPVEDSSQLFFSCDDHWSAVGNAWAADIIKDYLVKQ